MPVNGSRPNLSWGRAGGATEGSHGAKTVEECVGETQAGPQRREPEHRIDEVELRDTLAQVHSVGPEERAELAIHQRLTAGPFDGGRGTRQGRYRFV